MKKSFYKNGISIGNTELDEIYDNAGDADALHMADIHGSGIVTGLGVTENSPTPDLTIDVAAGTGFTGQGKRVNVGSAQAVDCTTDRDSNSIIPSAGNERYISIVGKHDRALSDPVTDPVDGTLYTTEDDSFTLEVVSGAEAATGTATRPTIATDEVLLADIGPIDSTTTQLTTALILDSRLVDLGSSGGPASDVSYDNASSGMAAENAQDAIDELKAAHASIIPTGLVLPFAGDTAPTGFLFCDGSTASRTTEAALFAVIGTRFGEGDGSTTFHLPNMQGQFIRGRDNGAGKDPDAASRTAMNTGGATGDNVGSVQDDALQKHNHTDSGHYHGVGDHSSSASSFAGSDTNWSKTHVGSTNTGTGYASLGDPTDSSSGAGTPKTSNETRPTNVALNFVIKT